MAATAAAAVRNLGCVFARAPDKTAVIDLRARTRRAS